jgi:hypothetical protein
LVTFIAAVSMLAGLFPSWRAVETRSTLGSVVVALGFTVALLAVVAALGVPERHLNRFDIGLLGLAVVLFLAEHAKVFSSRHSGGTDEAVLGHRGLLLLLAGRDPYSARIVDHAGTHLMTGGVVTHYSYPPLTLEIGWLLNNLVAGLGEPWVVAALGVAVTTVVVFFALPTASRALAIPVTLGFGFLDNYVFNGFPALVALPLLCLAGYRWTEIGIRGRLGRRGVAQATALGLAVSAQQLAWFVAALFLVAVWVVRSGELSRPRATALVGRFAGIALGVFAVVNLPFVLWDARTWLRGMLSVFTQQAKPFGGGLIVVMVDLIGRASDLTYLTYATAVLMATLLLVTAAGLRRIAAAVPVLASIGFLLNTRSDVEYFVAFIPFWLVWAANTDRELVAQCRPIRLPAGIGPLVTSLPRRCLAVSLALVPSVALAVLAITGAPPIAVHLPFAVRAGTRLAHLPVTVTNRSSGTTRASFSIGPRGQGRPWRALTGAVVLKPGESATLMLAPNRHQGPVSASWQVTVFTSQPPAFASAPIRIRNAPAGPSVLRAAP